MFGLPIQKKSAFTCTCFRRRDGGRSSPSLLSLVGSVLLGAGEIVSQTPDNFVSSHVRPPPQSRRCCVIFENSDFTLMCGPDSFFVSDAHSIFWRPLLPYCSGVGVWPLGESAIEKKAKENLPQGYRVLHACGRWPCACRARPTAEIRYLAIFLPRCRLPLCLGAAGTTAFSFSAILKKTRLPARHRKAWKKKRMKRASL